MTKLEQAARQALEALEIYGEHAKDCPQWPTYTNPENYPKCDCGFEQAITAMREALAEQTTVSGGLCGGCAKKAADGWALYCVECWEKAEQRSDSERMEPVYKALRVAEEALVYHTEQTRPIQKTDEAIIYLRNVMAQGVLNMEFTLEDEMAKYPEISYWHNEFLKHNTTTEQAEQEPVAWCELTKAGEISYFDGKPIIMPGKIGNDCHPTPLYAAPVRTKDLTDDEIDSIDCEYELDDYGLRDFARAVIAADRRKNK